MSTDLSRAVESIRIHNTHEHLCKEHEYVAMKPDILCELFGNYVDADLRVAGATAQAMKDLLDVANPDIAARFTPVQRAWEACQHTGYGEAARYIGQRFFDLESLTPQSLATAQQRLPDRWPNGQRLAILRDAGGFDHVQVDHFSLSCPPDESGPDFFLYDLSWRAVTTGFLDRQGNEVPELLACRDLSALRDLFASIFQTNAPTAIAIKSQHAYARTLAWTPRTDADAAAAFDKTRHDPKSVSMDERLCLSDWCLARGVELAIEHNLPIKIHTGYQAGADYMTPEWLHPNHLAGLIRQYPKARFVLMHMGWPNQHEMLALAKHFSNVWVDLCWAWQMTPRQTMAFVRDFLHAAPINKLLGFGGDTVRPHSSVAYAMQARKWITQTLQAEIDGGELTEPQAIAIATRILADNARDLFDVAAKRRAIADRLARTSPAAGASR
jgi:uncharacterized protein